MAITTSSCAEILAGNVIISQVEGTADDSESSNPQQGTVDAVGPEALSLPQVKAAQNEDAAPFFPTSSIKIPATRKDSRKLFVGGLPMDGMYLLPTCCGFFSNLE